MRRAFLFLLMLPVSLAAAAQTPADVRPGISVSTESDCVWKGDTFSVGATFCWQPGRRLTCAMPTADHKQAWWEDLPEPVCGSADVP